MDSVTQIALGAAIGQLVLGRKLGWRAALAGGICGTLPDLDVFVPLGDPVSDFTYHRSASHSLFVLAAASPIVAEIIIRIQKGGRDFRAAWHVLVFAVLMTHPLLDSVTVYGTQIFWPFDPTPVGLGSIFIIDPVYTLPLIIGIICSLAMKRTRPTGSLINALALMFSTAYLGWTILAQQQVMTVVERALEKAGIEYTQIKPIAGPFTSVFWRVVAVNETTYYNGYYSLLDGETDDLKFTPHSRNSDLLIGLEDDWATQRLQWFTKDFYTLRRKDGGVVLSDLRMGFEPNYVFTFKLATISNPHAIPLPSPQRVPVGQDLSGLSWVWQRIWSPDVPQRP